MLTIFKSRDFNFNLLQTAWSKDLNPLLKNPIMQGLALVQVPLINGTTVINHLLNRQMQGWFITDIDAAASIFRNAAFNEQTLSLSSSAVCHVNLWVY